VHGGSGDIGKDNVETPIERVADRHGNRLSKSDDAYYNDMHHSPRLQHT
jgi:hypothetical protein